jgi:hypothetical protein
MLHPAWGGAHLPRIVQAVKDKVTGETASEKAGRIARETADSTSQTAQDAASKAQDAYNDATKPKGTWQVWVLPNMSPLRGDFVVLQLQHTV